MRGDEGEIEIARENIDRRGVRLRVVERGSGGEIEADNQRKQSMFA